MGEISKRSAVFLLSFVMLLTLSGFGLSAKAQKTLDDSQQNQKYFQLCIENKSRGKVNLDVKLSVRYQQSDGAWVSILDREGLYQYRGNTFPIPVGTKKIVFKVEKDKFDIITGNTFWKTLCKNSVVINNNCHLVHAEFNPVDRGEKKDPGVSCKIKVL